MTAESRRIALNSQEQPRRKAARNHSTHKSGHYGAYIEFHVMQYMFFYVASISNPLDTRSVAARMFYRTCK